MSGRFEWVLTSLLILFQLHGRTYFALPFALRLVYNMKSWMDFLLPRRAAVVLLHYISVYFSSSQFSNIVP